MPPMGRRDSGRDWGRGVAASSTRSMVTFARSAGIIDDGVIDDVGGAAPRRASDAAHPPRTRDAARLSEIRF